MLKGCDDYRVRQARVEVCNGYSCHRELRWLAERRVKVFWLLPIWWPVIDGEWRRSKSSAVDDAHHDAVLRAPMADYILFNLVVKPSRKEVIK